MELPSDLNSLIGKHVYYVSNYFTEGKITKIEQVPELSCVRIWLDNNHDKLSYFLSHDMYLNIDEALDAAIDAEDYWRYIVQKLCKRVQHAK